MDVSTLVANTFKYHFPDIPVNREKQEDGSFVEASFFVQQLETQAVRRLGNEQMRHYNFDVIYYVDQNNHPVKHQLEMHDAILGEFDYLRNAEGEPVAKIQNLRIVQLEGDLHIMFSVPLRMGKVETESFSENSLTHSERFK
ncbi:phage tail terminator family protein [Weissella tructae]